MGGGRYSPLFICYLLLTDRDSCLVDTLGDCDSRLQGRGQRKTEPEPGIGLLGDRGGPGVYLI